MYDAMTVSNIENIYMKHLTGDKPKKSFPCPECDKVFGSNTSLYQHKLAIHSKLTYSCVCGKVYNHKRSLWYHQKFCPVHIGQSTGSDQLWWSSFSGTVLKHSRIYSLPVLETHQYILRVKSWFLGWWLVSLDFLDIYKSTQRFHLNLLIRGCSAPILQQMTVKTFPQITKNNFETKQIWAMTFFPLQIGYQRHWLWNAVVTHI